MYTNKFIIFNTKSQASNYIRKHINSNFEEGCGCCWSSIMGIIDNNKVVRVEWGEHKGQHYANAIVIGKIRSKR